MKIIEQTDNRICIELTREDMAELDITYEALDYANIETRRVLWTLLDEARHELGKNISLSQKMLIEAVPKDDGGCVIYFTVSDEENFRYSKQHIVKQGDMRTVCQSNNIDNIGALAKALSNASKIRKSELYTDGEKYRLIISPKHNFAGDIESTACEFCDICEPVTALHTYEHWKLLASPDAVGVLSALS